MAVKHENETVPVGKAKNQHECRIHKTTIFFNADDIRREVCVSDIPFLKHSDGNYYCLFHLPTTDKDIVKFNEIFQIRLDEVKQRIADIEKLPEHQQEREKSKIFYNFRYVYFPSRVDFQDACFSVAVSFKEATFSGPINFQSAKFLQNAEFRAASFLTENDFSFTSFNGEVDFYKANFRTFANFYKSTFTKKADFTEVLFEEDANFKTTVFEKTSRAYFHRVNFKKIADFSYACIESYLSFEGNQNNEVFIAKDSLLNLQKTRIADAKKVSFHSVRLESSWFINTDATDFIFTDCQWRYSGGKSINVTTELKNLNSRVKNPNPLLTKACWQLADNHEESKSFIKSSLFRQIAQESKRLKKPWYLQPFRLHWWYYASSFYGERWQRALGVLAGILLIFTIYYCFALFQICPKNSTNNEGCVIRTMRLDEAVQHS